MGGASSSEDTRVTRQEAMAAVSQAFQGKGSTATLSIKEIVLAGRASGDTWKTSNHRMHEWRAGSTPNSPARVAPAGGYPSSPGPPAPGGSPGQVRDISWNKLLESGPMTRDARMAKIRMMFNALDQDDSKVIEREEFVAALAAEGMDQQEGQALFRKMDTTNSGKLTIAKFDNYVATTTLELIKDTFKLLHPSKDRVVEKKEFKAYFMGNGLSQDQASALWNSLDTNKNGKISFIEFREWAQDAFISESVDQVAAKLGIHGAI
eukprot:TRINITY_DN105500_c0_g1_i1.p1 TRINITY_DN105500_c0_g1~~TRINITY_DN105500_c0_g1_i1.p1  ORF type:complete len:264 (+),score=63.26 TRINITY_DN105500_c0_g1_i1:49-840(+)